MTDLSMTFLQSQIRYTSGFRDDVVVFVRLEQAEVIMTNLRVDNVPAKLSGLCKNVAESALLAYVIANGYSVQYAHLDHCVEKMQRLAVEFAVEFLQPLQQDGVTQIIPLPDIDAWYRERGLYTWGRYISSAPGEEFS